MLVPEYANTAFSLTDPQKVSRIVNRVWFHIIQLIAKQDDQVNSRHILMRPKYHWKIKILLPNVLIVSLKQYVQAL